MARSRMRRRRPRRRRRYRRRNFNKARYVIARAPLFGKRKLVKMRFSESGQLPVEVGAGPPPQDKWRCVSYGANAAGKPSVVSEAKPEGWGLIAPLFQRAYTLSSRIIVTWLPSTGAHSAVPWVEKSTTSLATLLSPDLNQVLANKFVNYGISTNSPSGNSKIQKKLGFSTKKWFSVKDVMDAEEFSQDTSTSPTLPPNRPAYYNIGWTTTHPTQQGTANIDYVVTIDYLVMFVGPNNVA